MRRLRMIAIRSRLVAIMSRRIPLRQGAISFCHGTCFFQHGTITGLNQPTYVGNPADHAFREPPNRGPSIEASLAAAI